MKVNRTKCLNNEVSMNINDVKTLAQTLLHIDKDRFDLEYIKSEKIKQIINKIIERENSKESSKNGIAFVIQLCEYPKLPNINAESIMKKLDAKEALKRRALSPSCKNTYIGLCNVPNKAYFHQEKELGIRIKRVKVHLKSKNQQDSICRDISPVNIQTNINEEERRKEFLASLCNKYTYKFLKNPYLASENPISNLITCKNTKISKEISPMVNKLEQIRQKKEISNEIVFDSPFYKKKNRINNRTKGLSRILSKEEIDQYSSNIWREAHSGRIPKII